MDSTAFAYAGLTGNSPIDWLGTDGSRRLRAFSRVVRLEAHETLHAPGEAVRHVYFPAGCVAATCAAVTHGRGFLRVENPSGLAAASCGCYGLLAAEYGKVLNDLAGL